MGQKIVNTDGEEISSKAVPMPSRMQATTAMQKLEIIDPDKINPLEFRVLLRVCGVEELTDGGIFKPESFFERELFDKTEAVFVSCGDEAFTCRDGDYIRNKPEPGDLIITTKYAGNVYRDEGFNLYRFCNDQDVVATIESGGKE